MSYGTRTVADHYRELRQRMVEGERQPGQQQQTAGAKKAA